MSVDKWLEKKLGLKGLTYKHNLSKNQLFHEAIANDRGRVKLDGPDSDKKAFSTKLGDKGPLVFLTDPTCTGRPVNDTFAVAYPEVEGEIWWKDNLQKFDPEKYEGLLKRVVQHVNERGDTMYVQDVFAGSNPEYAVPYRFVGQYATHAMFAHNMFPKNVQGLKDADDKQWMMLNVQSFRCDPKRDGTLSDRAAIIDFKNKICLVVGRADYCGLVKKTIFTVMNFLLPKQGYLSMHCSGNIGDSNDSAIMFGLSGTGKTTLSADPHRKLISDDETGWTASGVSNLEDGCYAKLIDLDKKAEPVIAAALSMEGTIIENVPPLPNKPYEQTDPQELDLTDGSRTENTRFSYPLSSNPNVAPGAQGGHPETIVLLTADAFGVLPPVSILNDKDVMYHFVQGFTAKLAGTEVGLTAPEATFSSCFGAPFMSLRPSVYAKLLAEKMKSNDARCILLNTGWSGGPAGEADRMKIGVTRALLNAGLEGKLHNGNALVRDGVFGLHMPKDVAGVDSKILHPRSTWKDQGAYFKAAENLRGMFQDNFKKNDFGSYGIKPVM